MKRLGLTVVLLVIITLIILGLGYTAIKRNGSLLPSQIIKDSGSNISDYTAVFLTNGQVYFGKVYANSGDVLDLRDIYYLQVNQTLQQDTTKPTPSPTATPSISLIKLGKELHGPNDRMLINRSQILFTESLKNDSQVVTSINKYISDNTTK